MASHHFFGGNFSVKFSSCCDQCAYLTKKNYFQLAISKDLKRIINHNEILNMKFSAAFALLVIVGFIACADALPARKSELTSDKDSLKDSSININSVWGLL